MYLIVRQSPSIHLSVYPSFHPPLSIHPVTHPSFLSCGQPSVCPSFYSPLSIHPLFLPSTHPCFIPFIIIHSSTNPSFYQSILSFRKYLLAFSCVRHCFRCWRLSKDKIHKISDLVELEVWSAGHCWLQRGLKVHPWPYTGASML